jgi:hypothetical protein
LIWLGLRNEEVMGVQISYSIIMGVEDQVNAEIVAGEAMPA